VGKESLSVADRSEICFSREDDAFETDDPSGVDS